jgi:hypothetical protein
MPSATRLRRRCRPWPRPAALAAVGGRGEEQLAPPLGTVVDRQHAPGEVVGDGHAVADARFGHGADLELVELVEVSWVKGSKLRMAVMCPSATSIRTGRSRSPG